MKTTLEWFNQLEEPYKSRAIANTSETILKAKAACLSDALAGAFEFKIAPEGKNYWSELLVELKINNK